MLTWLIIGAGAATAAALAWWLARRRKKRQGLLPEPRPGDRPSPEPGERDGRDDGSADRERREREELERRAREDRERRAEEALQSPEIADKMLSRAGMAHLDLRDVSSTRQAAIEVAKRLTLEQIEALRLAAAQKDVDFDLQRTRERAPVAYPTADIEPEAMRDFAQLPAIAPEQLAMDDDQFCAALCGQELSVLQPYESRESRKRIYILLDVSQSMEEKMADGLPRHVWARGVTANLLLKAVHGEAEYILRTFDGECHEKREANDAGQADGLIDHILDRGFSGAGTNIYNAFATAVRDIRSRGDGVERSEVLIITDGEDRSMDDTETVKKLMGQDINLNVILIGTESDALKRAATTCRTVR